MSRMYGTMLSVVLIALLSSSAFAGDKEDVIAASEALSAAWNGTDVEAIRKHYTPGFNRYAPDGNLLIPGGWDWESLKQLYQNGLKVVVAPPSHQEVALHGNTAILTSYLTVTVTLPGGTARTTTSRASAVWIKQGAMWKSVHLHASLLTPPQSN